MDRDKDMGNKCFAIFQTFMKNVFVGLPPPIPFWWVFALFAFKELYLISLRIKVCVRAISSVANHRWVEEHLSPSKWNHCAARKMGRAGYGFYFYFIFCRSGDFNTGVGCLKGNWDRAKQAPRAG